MVLAVNAKTLIKKKKKENLKSLACRFTLLGYKFFDPYE